MKSGTFVRTFALAAGLALLPAGAALAQTPTEIAVSPLGTFETATGAASVSGTFSCGESSGFTTVEVVLLQDVGRVATVSGHAFAEVPACSPGATESWTATVAPDSGQYRGGQATAHARLVVEGQGIAETAASVRLRGGTG